MSAAFGSPADAAKRSAAAEGRRFGPIGVAALAIAAFLFALAGSLWIFVGEATFSAMVGAGAQMLCL